MPPKPKPRDTKSNVPVTIDQINLQRYCPKEIFDILFVNESDDCSRDVLDKVFKTGRQYEDISCLTVITYDEVMDLLEKHEHISLPPTVKPTLGEICMKVENILLQDLKLPSNLLAQLMKIKLTEVMYRHRIKEVTKMLKRKKLEADLDLLTKECKANDIDKGKGKGGKVAKDSKSGTTATDKKGKDKPIIKTEVIEIIEDYTAIPIEAENDIIFDDDIFNHVWFYAFQGFYDPDLLRELYAINVPITAVIKVNSSQTEDTTTCSWSSDVTCYEDYWNCLFKYFDGPKRLVELENTILMNFNCSGTDFMQIFQQLLYVIKNISDIKLQHVNYVRHIKIYEVKEVYNAFPLECLNIYNKLMDKIPFELVTEPVILSNLLSEVCTRVNNAKSTTSILENPSYYSVRSLDKYSTTDCMDPCKIDVFFKNKKKIEPEKIISKKPVKNFLTHECDELNIILNSYKKYGSLVCDPVLNLLKIQRPLHLLNNYSSDYTQVLHKHDIDPSTKRLSEDEEIIMHIFYLIFFSMFDCNETLTEFKNTDLTENLQIYHRTDFIRRAQTTVLETIRSEDRNDGMKIEEIDDYGINLEEEEEEGAFEEENGIAVEGVERMDEIEGEEALESFTYEESRNEIEIERLFRNYYNDQAIEYFWREKLPSDVLLQEIYKAHNDYSYMKQIFSPGTDNMLLQFSDCLDEFGVNTKIYEQSLITPICLRDFCRYVTVEKSDWLEFNKPPKYFRKCEELEICKGVNRINRLQLFPEYSHLLETTINTENESEEKVSINEDGVSFEQLLNELRNYPPNTGIVTECNKLQYDKNFLAYDLGTNYFQIKGGKTVFHSHDDVKISIDNTRFLDEEPKCSIHLSSKGNSLIVHYNKAYFTDDYTFHMHLASGIIVTFIVINPELRKAKKKMVIDDFPDSSYLCSVDSPEEMLPEHVKEEEYEVGPEELPEEVKVLSVDQSYFRSLQAPAVTYEDEDVAYDLEFKDPEAIFNCLRVAAANNCPIYKVNNNLMYLKRLKPKVEIPLSNILDRILHKAIKKKHFESFTKRYLPKKQKPSKLKRLFEARIAWPNGLYLSFYPSEMKNSYVEVKQEFLTKKLENSLVDQEEFRLFTREGYILVKHIDGTIKILKSNGDVIFYEKLDADDATIRKWRLRPCHCKNINDYRKKLHKIMRRCCEPPTPAAISRRGQFHTKKGYVLNADLVNILDENKVPYLKSTLLKFDGNRICLEDGKVTQKRIFHVTDEQDFFAQEMYYERSDGFRSYFDKDGKQQVKFADGTKISSTIHVAKHLARGYVYISLNFRYEHPNYATVLYNFDDSLDVRLNNNSVFKWDAKDTMSIKIGEDILTTVKRENVVFDKTCQNCLSKFKCTINIDPFCEEKMYSGEIFLHARDSYNKHFCSDYAGNCRRNSNYIKGPFNVFNCNHYKRMCYKKMFVVNRNFSGYTFWTDNMVDTKRKVMQNDDDAVVTNCRDVDNSKVAVTKMRRKVYEQYSNRFLNTGLLKEQMCLAKYKHKEVKQLFYTTSRVIKKMTDFEEIQKCLADIKKFFMKFGAGTNLLDLLDTLSRVEENHPDDKISLKTLIAEVEEPPICKCVKEKVNTSVKIERWQRECEKYRRLIRNNIINPYFTSEFCQVVKGNT